MEKKKFLYYYCKNDGHLKRNCKKQKMDLASNTKVSRSKGVSELETLDYDDGEPLLVATCMVLVRDSWFIDYGSSYYVCE